VPLNVINRASLERGNQLRIVLALRSRRTDDVLEADLHEISTAKVKSEELTQGYEIFHTLDGTDYVLIGEQ
jgi:hypothetical protein